MARSKLSWSDNSQAVRLPQDVAFPSDVSEVIIRRVGQSRVVSPINATWDDFFDQPGIDFPDRDQPSELPDRDPL